MGNCKAKTTKGKSCSRETTGDAELCWQHEKDANDGGDGQPVLEDISSSSLPEKQVELAKVLVEQYKTITQGIVQRVEQQQKLLYFQFIFIGILVAIYARNPSALLMHDSVLVLLITPLILMYFVVAHSRHDFMIISYARFIALEIWPSLGSTIDCSIPSWEQFLAARRQKYALPLSIFGSEYGPPLILCIFLFPASFWLIQDNTPLCFSFAKGVDASTYAYSILFIELILTMLVIKLRWVIVREYASIPDK